MPPVRGSEYSLHACAPYNHLYQFNGPDLKISLEMGLICTTALVHVGLSSTDICKRKSE